MLNSLFLPYFLRSMLIVEVVKELAVKLLASLPMLGCGRVALSQPPA